MLPRLKQGQLYLHFIDQLSITKFGVIAKKNKIKKKKKTEKGADFYPALTKRRIKFNLNSKLIFLAKSQSHPYFIADEINTGINI